MQEIMAQQGTRLDTKNAPWETYSQELDQKLDPQLAEAVEEYSQRHHKKTGSQAQEELCRQKELSDSVAKEYQWLTPEEYEQIEPRIGRPMNFATFITKLRNDCKLKCFYREHVHADKLTLVHTNAAATTEPEVACWVAYGWMPEFSIMRFDDHGVPLNERRRGWRTCLLQMILKGILNESTVTRVFGEATGPASERYNSLLQANRNREER